jgi:hypothetical protein
MGAQIDGDGTPKITIPRWIDAAPRGDRQDRIGHLYVWPPVIAAAS